jgi:AcrR family transcriptional regulator
MPLKRANKRSYDASSRQNAARATRRAILESASALFLRQGYVATSMPAIAQDAGVALDTIYASAGAKPKLFKLLVETAISGADDPIPAEERDYVRAIRAETDPRQKIKIYAAALALMQPRLAPLLQVLKAAADTDQDLRHLWQEISERRAQNMRLFANDIAATGWLRSDVSAEMAADILWSMNSPEYYSLLVEQRQWSVQQFEAWLAQAWVRLLLK